MIDEAKFLEIVSETNADIGALIDLTKDREDLRDLLVKHLLETDSINVYYHSYLILNEASKVDPSIFYCYWDKFVSLLEKSNSYHRNYGMDLLANLAIVDKYNKFELIIDLYYRQLYDKKITTKKKCIGNSYKIIKYKPNLTTTIITKIINSLIINDNSERHQNYLISEFLKLLALSDNDLLDITIVNRFLKDVLADTTSRKIKKEINQIMYRAMNLKTKT